MNTTWFEKGIEKGIEKGLEKGIDEGRIDHAQKLIIRLGTRRCGTPDSATQLLLASIKDLERLDRMHDRLTDPSGAVSAWHDILATP